METRDVEFYRKMGSKGGKASVASGNHKIPSREAQSRGGYASAQKRRKEKQALLEHDRQLNRDSNKTEWEKNRVELKLANALEKLRLKMEGE
jgi:general stress protein YciG